MGAGIDAPQGPIDLHRRAASGHLEAARQHGLQHLAGVDLLHQASNAGLEPPSPRRLALHRLTDGRHGERRLLRDGTCDQVRDLAQRVEIAV